MNRALSELIKRTVIKITTNILLVQNLEQKQERHLSIMTQKVSKTCAVHAVARSHQEYICFNCFKRSIFSFALMLKKIKVAPYSFWTARELISKTSRLRELSISTLKSRAESRSKMPTNMASKFLKFVYR